MAEGRDLESGSTTSERPEKSVLKRALDALDVLVSAHAALARVEAKNDLTRLVSGLAFAAGALALTSMAAVLVHALLVLAAESQLGWGRVEAIAALAAGDVTVAAALMLMARARLRAPVMVETRATLAKASAALRG